MNSINSLRFAGGGGSKDPNMDDPRARLAREKALVKKRKQPETASASFDSTQFSSQTSKETSALESATQRSTVSAGILAGNNPALKDPPQRVPTSSTTMESSRSDQQTGRILANAKRFTSPIFKIENEYYQLQAPSSLIPSTEWGKVRRIPRWDYKKHDVQKSAISLPRALDIISDRIREFPASPVEEPAPKKIKFSPKR